MAPDAMLALCRFVLDGAAMLLWGASGYLWAVAPPGLAARLGARFAVSRRVAIALAAAAALAMLPVQTAAIGDGWRSALDPAMLGAVLGDTSIGRARVLQALLAALLAATLPLPVHRCAGATAAAAGLLLASLAFTGHAAMHEGALGLAHRLNLAVHVLAAGAWLGALLPLLPTMRLLGDPACRAAAGTALRRFSAAGHGAVALVLVTGAINTALVLGRWPTDPHSPYQALLAVKIALVLAMTGLALLNRYGLVPRLRTHGAVAALRRSTVAEIGLGLAAIACVSVFGLLEPA